MKIKITPTALAAAILLAVTLQSNAQNMIGWHFDGPGEDTLLPFEIAGAPGFEQANWNNQSTTGESVNFSLVDNLGNNSGAFVRHFTMATDLRGQHGQTATPNEKLMNSFARQNPILTLSGIPISFRTSGYSLIVYYGNDEGPSVSRIRVTEFFGDQFDRDVLTGDTARSSYGINGFIKDHLSSGSVSNYAVFTGLNDGDLLLSMSNMGNNGISAIQLVAAPEPGSFALIVLGSAALGLRRRRA